MTASYTRQALLVVFLALVFFLVVTALLVSAAGGEEQRSRLLPASGDQHGLTAGYLPAGLGCGKGASRSENPWESRSRSFRSRRRGRDVEPVARYNRVEGLFLGIQLPREEGLVRDVYHLLLWGDGGYGFSSKAWRYQLGLERWFRVGDESRDPLLRFAIGGEVHDLTETQDEWIIPTLENSLAALFLREDFQDYYRRTGASGYLEQKVLGRVTFRAEYRDDRYYNMPADPEKRKATDWSVFGGKKRFRPNPLIEEGQLRGAIAQLIVDTRDDREAPDEGWLVQASAEFYGSQMKSDYEFDRFILDLRRYQPLSYAENLDLRLRLGTGRCRLPEQFLFDLGGIGSLRGYRFKELTGDRFFLANAEYRLRPGERDFPSLFDGVNLILFFDAGAAWFARNPSRPEKGWKELTVSRLRSDVGIALSDRRGRVRVSFAKRTDSRAAPVVVTFRLNREF
ncbi:MAG: BamA/TamA family outer membrane protein [candidate division KSB1 bacterium]|nr:BamA/TamA family outer membrane protein [candidate division KSB1 bacterium]